MRYRNLGRSGLKVSVVGLGCNNFGGALDADGAARVVHAALDAGITFFDTAAAYAAGASEAHLGAALQGRRDKAVISTKFGGLGDPALGEAAGAKGGRAYVRRAVDAALARLGTDYIDLLQLHRPDPETPIAETLAALDDEVRAGRVRYLGCSGFAAWQLVEAAWAAKELGVQGFISALGEWSLLERKVEAELVPAARAHGYGLLPAFPLASGLLTGKVAADGTAPADSRLSGWAAKFITPERLAGVERIRVWAKAHDKSMIEVAIGWLAAQQPVGSVIAGASNEAQVRANAASGQWVPSAEALAELSAL